MHHASYIIFKNVFYAIVIGVEKSNGMKDVHRMDGAMLHSPQHNDAAVCAQHLDIRANYYVAFATPPEHHHRGTRTRSADQDKTMNAESIRKDEKKQKNACASK